MRVLLGALIGIGAIFGGMFLEGGHIQAVIQLTAFIVVVGGALGATLMTYRVKDILQSVYIIFGARINAQQKDLAQRIFAAFGKFALASGAICFVLGFIHVMENLDRPEIIGPGLAVSAVGPLYALFIKLFVSDAIQEKLRSFDHEAK